MPSNTPETQALERVEVTHADRELYLALGVFHTCEDKAILDWGWADGSAEMQAIARHRQSSSNAGGVGEVIAAAAEVCGGGQASRHSVNRLRAALASLSTPTAEPKPLADLVVQLSAIRTVLREAHFALDDSEDLSHLDEPVHAVPLDNVMRLHRALKACERFAPKDEAWEGPGPLVTQIIEHLGHHLTALTPPPTPDRIGKDAVREALGELWSIVHGCDLRLSVPMETIHKVRAALSATPAQEGEA